MTSFPGPSKSRIHDYAKDDLCLVSYEANFDMVASNSFSEPVHSISKPYGVKLGKLLACEHALCSCQLSFSFIFNFSNIHYH